MELAVTFVHVFLCAEAFWFHVSISDWSRPIAWYSSLLSVISTSSRACHCVVVENYGRAKTLLKRYKVFLCFSKAFHLWKRLENVQIKWMRRCIFYVRMICILPMNQVPQWDKNQTRSIREKEGEKLEEQNVVSDIIFETFIRNKPSFLCSFCCVYLYMHVSVCLTAELANGFRFPAEPKDFSHNLCVQTSSEAHPASCPMGTVGPFPEGIERLGRDADNSPHPVWRSRISRSYTSCPQESPWRVGRQSYCTIFIYLFILLQ
jgi:hypothetical protein